MTALPLATALRFAARELRGTLSRAFRGFGVFVACLALGVAAIAAVASLGRAFDAALTAGGDAILGGDLAFALNHRPAAPDQRAALAARGATSEIATLRAMARAPANETTALVEVKAVDAAWPLVGRATLADGTDARIALAAPTGDPALFPAIVEETLLIRLKAAIGDEIALGNARLRVVGLLGTEPDRLAAGLGFGPRLLVATDALAASGLLAPGSLVRWHLRLKLPATADVAATRAAIETAFPEAGWEIRSRADAAPGTRTTIERFVQFLTLVGLTTLVIGGVGVANAVTGHLERRRRTIAIWRALGATRRFVVLVHALEIAAIAALGIVLGLLLGAALPLALAGPLGDALGLGLAPVLAGRELALAALEGALVATLFVAAPLARAVDTPPAALIRGDDDAVGTAPWHRGLVPTVLIGAALLALAAVTAPDPRLTPPYLVNLAVALVGLRLVALAWMALLRRLPRPSGFVLRSALAAQIRPGAPTASIVLSIGLGLTLIVALLQVQHALVTAVERTLPGRAPSFFFLDVPSRDAAAFRSFLAEAAPDARIEDVPMLRGRITALKGVPVEKAEISQKVRFVLDGDRGITFSAAPPANSTVVEGSWWDENHAGPPLVSFDLDTARGLGLAIGDTIRVNVLGRDIEARVANFRKIEWDRLTINFFMVFSPDAFRGAPVTRLATLAFDGGGTPERETALMKQLVDRFPVVTAVRVKDALAQVDDLVRRAAAGIGTVAAVAIAAAVLVLAGALAARTERRLHDVAVLTALGATRRRLTAALALEFALAATLAGAFAALLGTLAAGWVLENVVRLPFEPAPAAVGLVLVASAAITVALGLLATRSALAARPADVLRAT